MASNPVVTEAPISTPSTPVTTAAPETSSQPAAPSLSDIVSKAAANAEKSLSQPAEVTPVTEVAKPAADTTTEAKPATDVAKPADATATTPNPLDKLGPLPAEKITAALADAPPEVQQFLKDKGLSVEVLTENARLAAQTTQYQELFPTLDDGKVALDGAQNFWKLDAGLPAVQSVEDFNTFMLETLVPMSYERDAAGNPIPDPANPGAFKNDGSIGKLIDFSASVRDSKIAELADLLLKGATTDEDKAFATDLKGAVEFLGNFIKAGYKQPGSKEDPATLPEWARKEIETAKRTNAEAKETSAKTSKERYDLSEQKVTDKTHSELSPIVQAVMDKATGLSDALKTRVVNMVWQELTDRMQKDPLYQRQRDQLSPTASDYEQRRVALNVTHMKPKLTKVLEDVIGDIGGPVVAANKDRHDKIDSQTAASAMEPRTSGTTLQAQPGVSSVEDTGKKALEMARATNPNAQPGGPEYWAAIQKLKRLPTAV